MLNSEEQEFLDRNGYLLIPDVLSAEVVHQMNLRLEILADQEGPAAGCARLTRWQKRLSAGESMSDRRIWKVYCWAFVALKNSCIRYLFRISPTLKSRMLAHVAEFPYPQSLLKILWSEILGIVNAAASEESGTVRVCDLVNKDGMFDVCFSDARVLSAARHVVGTNLKLSSLNYRAPGTGAGRQPLHIDWFEKRPFAQVQACNTLWLLDNFTRNNGATRVVPGSHTRNYSPDEEMDDPWGAHGSEVLIVARAGSVLIVNGQLWHGGTLNCTSEPRRIIQSYFVGREVDSQLDQKSLLTDATRARLSPECLSLLGLNI